MKRIGLLWVLVGVMTVGCSKTERTPPPSGGAVGTGGAAANDNRSDGDFVPDVVKMNLTEIELSRLALSKASSPDVKSFAQRMIDEHTAAAGQLKNALDGAQIEWPSQLDEKHRKDLDELSKKQGLDFDHEYAQAMVRGHQDVAARLESRLDMKSVQDWKTAAAGRTQTREMPDPKRDMGDLQVRPDKTDNPLTAKINQWAADTYPVVQKHLDMARMLENASGKRSTH